MVAIGSWTAERGRHAAAHRHAAWKVTFYRTGRIDSVVDGHTYRVSPGTVLVLPPGAAHAEIARTAYSNHYLLLDAPVRQPWPHVCTGPTALEIGSLLSALVREESSPDGWSGPCTAALLTLVDAALRRSRSSTDQPRAHHVVRRVEEIFERRYADPLTMASVAHEAGLSVSTLRVYFAESARPAPSTVLRQVRLRHAVDLLATSDLSLAAVATRCGYYSASHLSREVKAGTGRTPGTLRTTGLGGTGSDITARWESPRRPAARPAR